ncbi:hypothetical protein [Streptomyces sp. NPDC053048]|uniref:hypothetical protein n=1 Tax=Streptomyces sp. NPDC053048 TaxID=3365694 RepID=UPI0037D0C1BA
MSPELACGLIELSADDVQCCICRVQALLYAIDPIGNRWHACIDHHGLVVAQLIRGGYYNPDASCASGLE